MKIPKYRPGVVRWVLYIREWPIPPLGVAGRRGLFPARQPVSRPPPPPHPHALTSLGLALACISIEKAQISLLISFCKKKNRKFRIVLNAFRKFLSVCAVVSITNQVLL